MYIKKINKKGLLIEKVKHFTLSFQNTFQQTERFQQIRKLNLKTCKTFIYSFITNTLRLKILNMFLFPESYSCISFNAAADNEASSKIPAL